MPAARGRSRSAAKKTTSRSRSRSTAARGKKKTTEETMEGHPGTRVDHGFVVADTDFFWSDLPEPHNERKIAMLKKYGPQINKLMGPEPMTKYIVTLVVLLQLYLAVETKTWSWPWYLVCAYVIGGTATHVLFLAIHEITHNLAFKAPWANDAFSFFANLPIVVPYSMMFKGYHAEHHRYQGWDGVDTDLPTPLEGWLFRSYIGKFIFLFCMIFFYALRPCVVRRQTLRINHLMNWVFCAGTMAAFGYYFGLEAIGYLLLSTFMAGTIAPLSGHFIAEHFIMDPKGVQETYSYYGPWNYLAWNVGLHNEHHDFPNVPWSRLWKLRQLAPEFYEDLMVTPSWPGALWRFLTDPKITARSRVKREPGAGSRTGKLIPTTTRTH